MKAVMLMFDSLNRHMLPSYGCEWTKLPNFRRLAERTVQFNQAYVCSMPCMPARREIHTGRPNFLHRSWGPLEPFDDSMPELLREAGVYTHLSTDHYHYYEDGGATYHNRYNTWEFFRGQEGDAWMPQVAEPKIPEHVGGRSGPMWRQDWVNRQFIVKEEQFPQRQTMQAGLDFITRNHGQDRWFLHIETFDPHEPFFSPEKFKDLYPHRYAGKHFDWPAYRKVQETAEEVEHCRMEYAALMSMCDANLGRVLDAMDQHDLWKDTMLIVCTDHGFILGEHESWAKCWLPLYGEVAHVPLFVWDPRCGARGVARESLVQTIDFAPTVLEYFGLSPTKDMIGRPLRETVAKDTPVRAAGMFGVFGGQINVTDGRHVYMRAPQWADPGPNEYTMMPTHMRNRFSVDELRGKVSLAEGFGFTKGCRVMKIATGRQWPLHNPDCAKTMLFNLATDPRQEKPITDAAVEARMMQHLRALMTECEAPREVYERMGM